MKEVQAAGRMIPTSAGPDILSGYETLASSLTLYRDQFILYVFNIPVFALYVLEVIYCIRIQYICTYFIFIYSLNLFFCIQYI